MLTVRNDSKNYRVGIICNRINSILTSNQDFWKEILSHTDNFYLANINGPMLHRFYHETNIVVSVNTFKSKNPFTKSNGYTKEEYPNYMWLNTRRFNRSEASIGATVAHETVHNVDALYPQYTFGHGDNTDKIEKDACAPQWFADVLYKYLSSGIVSSTLSQKEKYIV